METEEKIISRRTNTTAIIRDVFSKQASVNQHEANLVIIHMKSNY